MVKRQFSRLNADVSLLGFGCMRFPLLPSGEVDIEKTRDMIDYAIKNGVNYFDTAYVYHSGKSESIIGSLLRSYDRKSYYLADKMPGWSVRNIRDAERIFQEQLKRCGVDYFDFYLCHSVGREGFKVYKDFLLDFLKQKKAEGVIKRLGFSFHDTPEALVEIADFYEWDFAQIQYNYYDFSYQRASEQYEILAKRGIPVIIMEPVRGGMLAELNKKAVDTLRSVAPDKSVASWAIRFSASPENVLTVLSGMSSFDQVKDNIETLSNFSPLKKSETDTLFSALDIFLSDSSVPCTGCAYCSDCPVGVNIPAIFKAYNEYSINKNKRAYENSYNKLKDCWADKCVFCGNCAEICPQKIDVPRRMAEIAKSRGK